jgi:hypothetical protein
VTGGTATDAATYLRDTARLMRERADAATKGRWGFTNHADMSAFGPNSPAGEAEGTIAAIYHGPREADAEHVASWDPTVARAVADLLDFVATVEPNVPRTIYGEHAMAIARAYNREVTS